MASSDGLDSFVETGGDGPSVDWSGIGQLLTGSLLLTAGLLVTEIYVTIISLGAAGLRWIASTVSGLYLALAGAVQMAMSAAFGSAEAFVSSFSILGPPIGIALALFIMWIWMRDS